MGICKSMSNNKPLVSILTPTYNRSDLLPIAIKSVLEQTYKNIEMLVIDDGSTDNTKEVINELLQDKRVHYYYQENQGQSVARNRALKECKGEMICFLDSDNLFKPDKIAFQISFLRDNPDVDIIYGDNETIDTIGCVLHNNNMKRYSGNIYKRLLIDNFVSMNTAMVRKNCFDELGGMDESIRVADDYDLWLRFSTRYNFKYEPVYFSQYRVMENQISSDKGRRFESNRTIIERSINDNPQLLDRNYIKYVWCRFYTRRGRSFCASGQKRKGLADYITAIRYNFFCLSPWQAILKALVPG
jgi:glycosyltransferase involved in cell wall biosynthesis